MKKQHYIIVLLGALVLAIASYSPAVAQQKKTTTEYKDIKAELKTRSVSFQFKKQSLQNVIQFINRQVNFNLILDQRVINQLKPSQRKVTLSVKDIQLNRFLTLLMNQKDLEMVYTHGTVKVVPKEVGSKKVLRYYDIRDLKYNIPDFHAPRLELKDPDEARAESEGMDMGSGFLEPDAFNNEKGGILKNNRRLKKLIRDLTGSDITWSPESGATMRINNGTLIIKQSKDIHKEVLQLLKRLRSFR